MRQKIKALAKNIQRVFKGDPNVVRTLLEGFFAAGHILIEDVPGVGKTVLAKALARSIDCSFQRIQFTSDLLPSDIVGVSVYDSEKAAFVFKHGPVFTNVILADEINRTTPRTQSSLLEAMNDYQVSVDGITYALPKPFMVVATQNPYEFEGTFPLPENQLDRFMISMSVGYPTPEAEKLIIANQHMENPVEILEPVITQVEILEIQRHVRELRIDDDIADYIVRFANATRENEYLQIGMSPRSCTHLARAAQAKAFLAGRDYVLPDDVKQMAGPVIAHRIKNVNPFGDNQTQQNTAIIADILDATPVPV